MKVAIVTTLKQYCRTTTLHGLKYLSSPYYSDRIIWITWCFTTAGCAGGLCAALWARFLQMPALLTVRDTRGTSYQWFPTVVICPTPERIAQLFTEDLSYSPEDTKFVPMLFTLMLRRKSPKMESLVKLDKLLVQNNTTLGDALSKAVPPCHDILIKCRWQNIEFECDNLFEKQMTEWGVCCTMKPESIPTNITRQIKNKVEFYQIINLILDCYNESVPHACQFFWAFSGEPYHNPSALSHGKDYIGRIKFTSLIDKYTSRLVNDECDSSKNYTKMKCLSICKEKKCGCANPFRYNSHGPTNLPPCSVLELQCILQFDHENNSCDCANSCEMIRSEIAFESTPLSPVNYAYDPLYENINATRSTILTVKIRATASKLLYSMPTETWITLMSSLGGVFNMFLGVGFFSALEVIFYLIIRLPVTIRRYAEINPVD